MSRNYCRKGKTGCPTVRYLSQPEFSETEETSRVGGLAPHGRMRLAACVFQRAVFEMDAWVTKSSVSDTRIINLKNLSCSHHRYLLSILPLPLHNLLKPYPSSGAHLLPSLCKPEASRLLGDPSSPEYFSQNTCPACWIVYFWNTNHHFPSTLKPTWGQP